LGRDLGRDLGRGWDRAVRDAQGNPCRKARVTSAAQATWLPASTKLIEPA